MGELAPEINATLSRDTLILAPGDRISVRFLRPESQETWGQEDLVVQSDGSATFLSLDTLHVAGLTLEMLDETLTKQYRSILKQPDLTVRVTQPAARTVMLMGEVVEGGSFELPAGRLSLLEAIGMAQGFIRDTAQLNHTMLVRWIPEENRVQAWKIDASTDHWDAEESILLQAHDVIFIPAKPVVHVNDWINRYIRLMIPLPTFTVTY